MRPQPARGGKRGHVPASHFERKLEDNLVELQNELLHQTYQPGAYHSFYIHEPKRRLISATPFRDRVAHHALCRAIEPLFEQHFIADSYANRARKGTHRALDRCQDFARHYPFSGCRLPRLPSSAGNAGRLALVCRGNR